MSWSSAVGRLNTALTTTFGETITWTPAGGSETGITAIPSQSRTTEDETPTNYLLFWAKASDVPGMASGDLVAYSGSTYRVVEVDLDGGGGAAFQLELMPYGELG